MPTMDLSEHVPHMIGPGTAYRNLNTFNRIKNEQSQLTIEYVEIQNVFKRGTFPERMRGMIVFERQPISTEPIVVEMTKIK